MTIKVESAWLLVAMRTEGDGWVVDCDERVANEVRGTGPHIEDVFNLGEQFPTTPGLHVWEGNVHVADDEDEDDVLYVGAWRRARAAEIIAFASGRVRTTTWRSW